MQARQIHEDKFLKILWDENKKIIGIDWKETTSGMTDEEFKTELTLFAGYVEEKKASGIVVDVANFVYKMGPDIQQWRVKNISSRYTAAGVKRFAFVFPKDSQIPPMMNQSSAGESFLTRAFNSLEQATVWLTAVEK